MEKDPVVGIIMMGSKSDWKVMQESAAMLSRFEIPHERRVLACVLAYRKELYQKAEEDDRWLQGEWGETS